MESSFSGSYTGEMTRPNPGTIRLDLRVDIDRVRARSIVTNRISGDFYSFNGTGSNRQLVFLYSWIVNSPDVIEESDRIVVSGTVHTSNSTNQLRKVSIIIEKRMQAPLVASVTFMRVDTSTSAYECLRTSQQFRNVNLEIDICQSVYRPNGIKLPNYDTHSVATRPDTLEHRKITLEDAFAEAGIGLTINSPSTILDDSAPRFESWSDSELHHNLAVHFSEFSDESGKWPKWSIWSLLARRHDDPSIRGIMFDTNSFDNIRDRGPRQGFAVFLEHPDLAPILDSTLPDHSIALRMYLRVLVHEAAHTFNLFHPGDLGNPSALTWMNYPHVFDSVFGMGEYWKQFRFSFERNEIIHLRHGEFKDVVMGANFGNSNIHDQASFNDLPEPVGVSICELSIRSQQYYDFLEPVQVELRMRNLSIDSELPINRKLSPEHGVLRVLIQRPDGRIRQFRPMSFFCSNGEMVTLTAKCLDGAGTDRWSHLVDLTYGSAGFMFDSPGQYLLRASYTSSDLTVTSADHRISIGYPQSREIEILAQDYFSNEIGISLNLNISRSPKMRAAFQVIEQMVEEPPPQLSTNAVAKLASKMASSISRPFHGLGQNSVDGFSLLANAEVEKAIELSNKVIKNYQMVPTKAMKAHNLAYASIAAKRIAWLVELGDENRASKSISDLLWDLTDGGVRKSVRDRIYSDLIRIIGLDVDSEQAERKKKPPKNNVRESAKRKAAKQKKKTALSPKKSKRK